MKKTLSLLVAAIMLISLVPAVSLAEAEEMTYNAVITDYYQMGNAETGVLKCGSTAIWDDGFKNDATSFLSGGSWRNGDGSSESPYIGNVGYDRATFLRFEIPASIDRETVSSVTVDMTAYYTHNFYEVEDDVRYLTLTLFELNEALPDDLSDIGGVENKGDYTYSAAVAESNHIPALTRPGDLPVQFDITEYVKENPDLDIFEFEMLTAYAMVDVYDTSGYVNAGGYRGNFPEEYYPQINVTYAIDTEALVEEAADAIVIGGGVIGTTLIGGDLTLPTELSGYPAVSVSWESSDEDFVANDGSVSPDRQGTVTLTATVTAGSASATRSFTLSSGSYTTKYSAIIDDTYTFGAKQTGLLRAGSASSDTSTDFTKDSGSYLSGGSSLLYNTVNLGWGPGGGSTQQWDQITAVGSNRAAFMRFEVPAAIDRSGIKSAKLNLTGYYTHNFSPAGSSGWFSYDDERFLTLTLFALDEALPDDLSSISDKAGYGYAATVAESNRISAIPSPGTYAIQFDIADYMINNPDVTVFEFEMLPAFSMVDVYDASGAITTNEDYFPNIVIEYEVRDPNYANVLRRLDSISLGENYTEDGFVIGNLTLEKDDDASGDGITVWWESTGGAIDIETGEYTKPYATENASLTVHVHYSDAMQLSKTFDYTAVGSDNETLSYLLENLAVGGEIEGTTVLGDLVLATEFEEYPRASVVWESSNEDAIAPDGTVNHPDAMMSVTLTANITVGDLSAKKEFSLHFLSDNITSLSEGLRVYYSFNGDEEYPDYIADHSGNNLDAYVLNDNSELRIVDGAAYFPGYADRNGARGAAMLLPDHANDALESFTVSMWVKPDENYTVTSQSSGRSTNFYSSGKTLRFFDFANVGSSHNDPYNSIFLRYDNSAGELRYWDRNQNKYKAVSSGNLTGNWHLLTVTYEDRTVNIYIDGELAATESGFNRSLANLGTIEGTNNGLLIGRTVWGYLNSSPADNPDYKGYMDEIRVYDRAVTGDEVMALYNATAPEVSLTDVSVKYTLTDGTEIAGAASIPAVTGTAFDYAESLAPEELDYEGESYIFSAKDSTLHIDKVSSEESGEIVLVYIAAAIVDVESPTVYTLKGQAPYLPAYLDVTYNNGKVIYEEVTWDEIDEESYAEVGTFTVSGVVAGESASATVIVREITEIENVSAVTYVGRAPELPYFIGVTYNDGEEDSLYIEWDDIDPKNYAEKGEFDTSGVIYDAGVAASAHVTVFDPYYNENGNITGAKGDLTLYYLDEAGEDIETVPVNAPYGTVFTLTEEYIYLGISTRVTAIGEGSCIGSLDEAVTMNELDQKIYLICAYNDSLMGSISGKTEDGVFTAAAAIYNGTDEAIDVRLILAKYDADGMLTDVIESECPLSAHMSEYAEFSAETEVDIDAGEIVHAFVWTGLSTLYPVTGTAVSQKYTEEIMELMKSYDEIADAIRSAQNYWQSRNYDKTSTSFWHQAAYHVGNMEAYYLLGDEAYYDYSVAWGDANSWKGNTNSGDKERWTDGYSEDRSGTSVLFGDWQCCFQTFLDLYMLDESQESRKARAEEVISYQITRDDDGFWWWADGVFMVMPVMAKMYLVTGEEVYLDKMYEYFKFAEELMFDGEGGIPTGNGTVKDEDSEYMTSAGSERRSDSYFSNPDDYKDLFFRDGGYVYPRNSVSGYADTKNFWARGNGWVYAALAKVLTDIPADYTFDFKGHEINIYNELSSVYTRMSAALKKSQCFDDEGNGFWCQSMLIPNYPTSSSNPYGYETSGTAFFTYGLFWGINNGLLSEDEYLECALRGLNYLDNIALRSDGLVGYVQPIGSNITSATSPSSAQNFGLGAFLLANCEAARWAEGNPATEGYLKKKLWGSVAIKLRSTDYYANGVVTTDIAPLDEDGDIYVPAEIMAELFGFDYDSDEGVISDKNGNTLSASSRYVTLNDFCGAFDKHAINVTSDIIIITHKTNVFVNGDDNIKQLLIDLLK